MQNAGYLLSFAGGFIIGHSLADATPSMVMAGLSIAVAGALIARDAAALTARGQP